MKVRVRSLTNRTRNRAGYSIPPYAAVIELRGAGSEAAYHALVEDKYIELTLVADSAPKPEKRDGDQATPRFRKSKRNISRS